MPRHYKEEEMIESAAQLVARGVSRSAAFEQAGWKGRGNAYRITSQESFKKRVAEIRAEVRRGVQERNIDNRSKILEDLQYLWSWCVRINPVQEPCEKCGTRFEQLTDARNAVKVIELRGLEEGMFKRHLDITSRKTTMIDGTEDQITDMLAQLIERLGVPYYAKLMKRIGDEHTESAMRMNGYQVTKANGHDDTGDDVRAEEDGGEPREAIPESLHSASEAEVVS